eukprot:GHVU01069733.1.p1 GENE.GHVU01069733.1~~GHVU01069733.1.p1  ORF type:complete len:411 (+),score=55.37 GHVU01069733.1:128-1360(+)
MSHGTAFLGKLTYALRAAGVDQQEREELTSLGKAWADGGEHAIKHRDELMGRLIRNAGTYKIDAGTIDDLMDTIVCSPTPPSEEEGATLSAEDGSDTDSNKSSELSEEAPPAHIDAASAPPVSRLGEYKALTTILAADVEQWKQLHKIEWKKSSTTRDGRGAYYKCKKYEGCRMRSRVQMQANGDAVLLTKGVHDHHGGKRASRGANPDVKKHVIPLLYEHKPSVVVQKANAKATAEGFIGTPVTNKQVKSLIRNYRRQLTSSCKIETIADLREWAQRHQINEAAADWDTFDDSALFVPPGGIFDDPEYPALALTTKSLLWNAAAAVRTEKPVCMLVDGTYKVHDKNYVVLSLGVESIDFDQGANRHSFRPIAVCLAVSESQQTYNVMMRSAAEGCKRLCRRLPTRLSCF